MNQHPDPAIQAIRNAVNPTEARHARLVAALRESFTETELREIEMLDGFGYGPVTPYRQRLIAAARQARNA